MHRLVCLKTLFHSDISEQTSTYDHSGKTSYIDECKRLGVVPASYFLRHMQDKHLSMKHHGLGAAGMKAIADSLTVSIVIVICSC